MRARAYVPALFFLLCAMALGSLTLGRYPVGMAELAGFLGLDPDINPDRMRLTRYSDRKSVV